MEITLPAGKYTLNLTNPITFVQETQPLPLSVRIVGGAQTINVGGELIFTAEISGGKAPFNISWLYNTTDVQLVQSGADWIQLLFNKAGSYPLTLRVADANSQSASDTVNTAVNQLKVTVPNLIGKTIADAIITCNQLGLVLSGPTTGTIKTQVPAAGTLVDIGSTVTVTIDIIVNPLELTVGPGQPISEIHQLPKLNGGETVKIFYRSAPYKAKIVLNKSNVKLIGVLGPNGERPILEGNNAIEVPWASYWSSAVSAQGIISVVPGSDSIKPVNVTIENLMLRNCRQAGAGFTKYNGVSSGWNAAAAGVALYRCEQVTIKNCIIEQCDNGIFGKSYGNASGDLIKIKVIGNTISNCGVSGSDRQHNSYIEGIDTIYEFNNYWKPVSGSAGCNLKDRSAGAIIRYNIFEGGARIIDLVDPEDGAASFLQSPSWGKTYLYRNIIANPQNGGSATMIHFGYDGMKVNEQKELYAYYNTIVNKNDRDAGGRWRTAVFKTHGTQKLHLANNILHSYCPTVGHSDGDFFLTTELPEENGSFIDLKNNVLVNHTQLIYIWNGAAFKGSAPEWLNQIKTADPGMVDVLNWNFELRVDSICKNKAFSLDVLGWPVTDKKPLVGWTMAGWLSKSLTSIGVSE